MIGYDQFTAAEVLRQVDNGTFEVEDAIEFLQDGIEHAEAMSRLEGFCHKETAKQDAEQYKEALIALS